MSDETNDNSQFTIHNSQLRDGYKQTDVGIIPEDWDVKSIIKCTDYVDYRGKTPTKTDSGRFLVTAKNIREGFIDYENSKEYIAESDYEEVMSRGKPKIGDVLITTEAPLGNVAPIDREDIALAQRVIKYRAKKEILDSDYLKHYFLGSKFRKILDDNSSGSTAQGIKGSVLHQLPVILPPLPEQHHRRSLERRGRAGYFLRPTHHQKAQHQTRRDAAFIDGQKTLAGF